MLIILLNQILQDNLKIKNISHFDYCGLIDLICHHI